MTEREKQQRGLYYSTTDTQLVDMIHRSQRLCYEYNILPPYEEEKRKTAIHKLIPAIGKNFLIEQPFHCDYGINIEIGDNFYANYNLTILDCAKVQIGNNCFIGPNVGIYTPNHPLDAKTRNTLVEKALPVTIGDNVWIGGGVSILGGVKIGNNCVIGAGAVVTHSIPDNSLAVGNPARVMRTIENE